MNSLSVYIRVSTDKQVHDGNGLDVQLNALNDFADFNDFTIDEYYIDRGRSATAKKRPEYDRMFKDVVAGNVKWLMVYKRDRLVRDVIDLYEVNEILANKCGCRVESLKDGLLSWSSAGDKFVHTIMAAKDRLEVEQVSERTLDALYASALKGNYTYGGNLPAGFQRCEREGAKKAIEPIPDQAPKIVRLFELIAENRYNCNSICRLLNSQNFLDSNKWTEQKVRKIVKNEIYIGHLVTKHWRIDNHTPAIINEELFDAARLAMTVLKRQSKHLYLFEKLFCSRCNNQLVRETTISNKSTKKVFIYYHCKHCKIRINEETLVESLILLINQHMIISMKNGKKVRSSRKDRLFMKHVFDLNGLLAAGSIDKHSYFSGILALYEESEKQSKPGLHEKKLFHELSKLEKSRYLRENIERIILKPLLNSFVLDEIIFNKS